MFSPQIQSDDLEDTKEKKTPPLNHKPSVSNHSLDASKVKLEGWCQVADLKEKTLIP